MHHVTQPHVGINVSCSCAGHKEQRGEGRENHEKGMGRTAKGGYHTRERDTIALNSQINVSCRGIDQLSSSNRIGNYELVEEDPLRGKTSGKCRVNKKFQFADYGNRVTMETGFYLRSE